MELTSKQRAFLRGEAHHLKPIAYLGKEGVTDAAVRAVAEAFNSRELLKVKLQQEAPLAVREAADALAERIPDVVSVASIGRTAILYRPHPTKPELRLPEA